MQTISMAYHDSSQSETLNKTKGSLGGDANSQAEKEVERVQICRRLHTRAHK